MDSPPEFFQVSPLPLESEFKVMAVKRRLSELSREELEEFLSDALLVMTKLAHQLNQMREYLEEAKGKTT